uniref:Uncharacterized protein n=1 Tax=Mycena chlorophos TaxID=658473 RepID=A0ABQ0LLJ1_MYCCL|nr:predicted protein [Mycena chlorophos]
MWVPGRRFDVTMRIATTARWRTGRRAVNSWSYAFEDQVRRASSARVYLPSMSCTSVIERWSVTLFLLRFLDGDLSTATSDSESDSWRRLFDFDRVFLEGEPLDSTSVSSTSMTSWRWRREGVCGEGDVPPFLRGLLLGVEGVCEVGGGVLMGDSNETQIFATP